MDNREQIRAEIKALRDEGDEWYDRYTVSMDYAESGYSAMGRLEAERDAGAAREEAERLYAEADALEAQLMDEDDPTAVYERGAPCSG